MARITTRSGIFCALLAASVCWQTSGADDATSAGLLACAKLGSESERLMCFDRLTLQLHSGPAPATPLAAMPASVSAPAVSAVPASATAGPPSATPASALALDMFGSTPHSEATTASAERTALKSITARVIALRDLTRGGAVMDLDNGQQWQQVGNEDLLLKIGDRVKISRGTFGSFWVMSPGNRVSHVKRIL